MINPKKQKTKNLGYNNPTKFNYINENFIKLRKIYLKKPTKLHTVKSRV